MEDPFFRVWYFRRVHFQVAQQGQKGRKMIWKRHQGVARVCLYLRYYQSLPIIKLPSLRKIQIQDIRKLEGNLFLYQKGGGGGTGTLDVFLIFSFFYFQAHLVETPITSYKRPNRDNEFE